VSSEPARIAEELGPGISVQEAIKYGKAALLEKRKMRTAPVIDRTLYTSLNGMMIAAYFHAYMILGAPELRELALRSLERVLRQNADHGEVLHCEGVRGLFEDYIHLIDALIAAYEATGRRTFLDRAEELMSQNCDRFLDRHQGGFYDTEEEVLGFRMKSIEDVPHSSANAVAIMVLLKLAVLTGNEKYRQEAERSLAVFSGPARSLGIHGGTYFCALHAYFRNATFTVEGDPETDLAREARAVAATSYASILYGENNGRVTACINGVCSEPVYKPEEIAARLSS
jgi:uncharacterized protein YyaL (SSP411 family)